MNDTNLEADLAAAVGSDRRADPRHPVRWPILLWTSGGPGPNPAHGHTLDVSTGGARIAVDHNYAVGDRLTCHLSIHPWHGNARMFDLDIVAKVVHSSYSSKADGFDVGLSFQSFEGDGKAQLAKVFAAFERAIPIADAKIVRRQRP